MILAPAGPYVNIRRPPPAAPPQKTPPPVWTARETVV